MLTYSELRELDRRFAAVEANVAKLVERADEADRLRERVAELEAQIAGAVDRSGAVEQGAREGLPAAT